MFAIGIAHPDLDLADQPFKKIRERFAKQSLCSRCAILAYQPIIVDSNWDRPEMVSLNPDKSNLQKKQESPSIFKMAKFKMLRFLVIMA